MNVHKNGDAAAAAGVSVRTGYMGLARYRAGGAAALNERKPTPARCPHRLAEAKIEAIERLRRLRWSGPRIARGLGHSVSTVAVILRRLGLGRLSALEARPPVVLRHLDSKQLGRIAGVGHRITGDRRGHRARGLGWEHLHVALDDAARLAYTELLPDARSQTGAGFLARAAAWFASLGVRIERVITDNALAYTKSAAFKAALSKLGARHLTARPYRPRTNGKAERFSNHRSARKSKLAAGSGQVLWATRFSSCSPSGGTG
jgi:transposase InsO family protein